MFMHFNSFIFLYFNLFLQHCTHICMFVLLTHIAVIVCSIYALLVNKVDVLTDGKIWSREMETERGKNSHRSTHIHGQAGG